MTQDVDLLVIAKAPVPGLVKTRLCPPCSFEEAARLAEAALIDTLKAVRTTPAARRLLVLDGRVGEWLPPGLEVARQVGGSLDRRLAGAFALVRGPAFLVGMDTPQLDARLLSAAVRQMMWPGIDAAMGHTYDGGYWGIGLKHPDPGVFAGVPMSTPYTARAQLDRLRSRGLRVAMLPPLVDVDRFADAQRVAAGIPASYFASVCSSVRAAHRMVS